MYLNYLNGKLYVGVKDEKYVIYPNGIILLR